MAVKSSAAQFFYTKVLIVVTLLACSSTSVAIAESISQGVIRSSRILNTLNTAHRSVSIKRNLRSNAAMTTSDRVNTPEERISFSGIAASLESIQSKIIQKLQVWWWRLRGKSSDDVFTHLKLHQEAELFAGTAFSRWAAFVKSSNKKSPEAAMDSIFATLSRHYVGDALDKVLVAGTKVDSTKSIALKLIDRQLPKWKEAGKTEEEVFTLLKLDETKAELFESPVFSKWVDFVEASNKKSPEAAMDSIFATLSRHYVGDALDKVLVAGTKVDSTKSIALKLIDRQLPKWKEAGKTEEEVFTLLKLDLTGDHLLESPILSIWTSYLAKLQNRNSDEDIVNALAKKFGDASLASMIAVAIKEDKLEELALGLRTAQFKLWLGQKRTPESIKNMLLAAPMSDDELLQIVLYQYDKFYGKVAK